MVHTKIAKAFIFSAVLPVFAHAGPTITAMLGYHDLQLGNDHQAVALSKPYYNSNNGQKPKNDIAEAYSLGYEFSPVFAAELEYLQTQAMATVPTGTSLKDKQDWDTRVQHYTANALFTNADWTSSVQKIKPYLLVGVGQEQLETKGNTRTDIHSSTDTIANLGGGAMYRFNDWLSARGEVRAVRNFDHDWWEAVALAGVQLGLRQAPVQTVMPPLVLPEPPVAPPAVCADVDKDGVCDNVDDCLDSPLGYGVNERGCPKVMKEKVEMQIKAYFDTNKAIIKPIYRDEVAKVAVLMKEFSGSTVTIEGHTDSSGSDKLNQKLSQARADAVRLMLVTEFGIDDSRISAIGYGETRPIADNNTKEGKAMNRRIMAAFSGGERTKVIK